MSDLILHFSAQVTAADANRRMITGQIVPFNQPGNTSAGKVIFKPNSIAIDASKVKMLLQHDATRPIGRMVDFAPTPEGINASFRIANTSAGTDGLIEAAEGLRDGLSVGASVHEYEYDSEGVMVVSSATLHEVSLVTDPAFKAAKVSQVAASEPETEEEETSEAEVPAEADNNQSEGESPVDETPEVTEEVTAAAVVAAAPVAYTKPRSPIVDGATYVQHAIRAAALGDLDSRQYVAAADDSTSTNTGLTLPNHLQTFVTPTRASRAAIEAVSNLTLDSSGMSFTVPKLGTAPTVAVVAEGGAPSETGMTSSYDTVDVKKFSGRNVMSVELIDRSSPSFFQLFNAEIDKAYANAEDDYMLDTLIAGGTAATATAATAAGLQSFIAVESAAAHLAAGDFAQNLVVNAGQWAAIMGYADTTGRALYIASAPSNASGAVSSSAIRGEVLGQRLSVDRNIAASGVVDDSAFLIVPEAAAWWQGNQYRVQVNVTASGEVEVVKYGYGAAHVFVAGGIRRWNTV